MYCGIDLGSRQVKIVLFQKGEVIDKYEFDTVEFYKKYGYKEEDQLVVDFSGLGLPVLDLGSRGGDRLVSTGYGRNTIMIKGGEEIPEIKAHALGAVWQTGFDNFTLLDLGGQDTKVVKVRNGKLADFQTNDKCAAGSGRYLENMAAVLGISLEELSTFRDRPVDLTATCAIFGESELVGKIIEGYPVEELGAGINYTIFKRIKPMLLQLISPVLVFTGGVAYNRALQEIIREELKFHVIVPKYPQHNGAIGCCVHAGQVAEQ
ncbi:acyl-CoA dehydratase activase [Phosphitispora sp. TUW77]|uniref:acyl-CoA dehydratase activase n=1 Tax=Phosphitispora sp. TUW77 TaxID=3152361 RepID=UPI003AB6CAB4